MKKHLFLRNAILTGILILAPLALSAKGSEKSDETIKDCTMPDGTICDLNLFKTEGKFNQDMEAHIGEQTKNNTSLYNEIRIFRNYRKLRNMTFEEYTAWKKSKTPVEDELLCIKSCTEKESNLLGVMKTNKTPYSSSYTEEDGRIRAIIATADKKYSSLTYEKFYLVERIAENADGAAMEKAILPDGTVTDLVIFLRDKDIDDYYISSMSINMKFDPGKLFDAAYREVRNEINGIPTEKEWRWERVYTPTKKDWEKARSNGGSITAPGYIRREYPLDKMGELGIFMKENEIPTAVIITDTGDKKRQEILVYMGMNWERFSLQKIDYAYRQKKD